MYLIEVKTAPARQWIDENVHTEPWQWLGQNLAVDHHFIEDLAYGMAEAGLTNTDVNIIHA